MHVCASRCGKRLASGRSTQSLAGTQMQPDILAKRVRAGTSEPCVIVCAYLEDGVTPEHGFVVRDTLNGLDTDGWWFFNPGTFVVAFRCSRAPAERSSACQAAMARLSKDIPALGHLGVGSAEGPVLTSIASAVSRRIVVGVQFEPWAPSNSLSSS